MSLTPPPPSPRKVCLWQIFFALPVRNGPLSAELKFKDKHCTFTFSSGCLKNEDVKNKDPKTPKTWKQRFALKNTTKLPQGKLDPLLLLRCSIHTKVVRHLWLGKHAPTNDWNSDGWFAQPDSFLVFIYSGLTHNVFSRLTSKHSFQVLFSSVRLLQGFEMSYIFIGAHWVIHIFCTVPLSFMGFMK